MSSTPSTVRDAFAPAHQHQLTLEATLVLEAIGCRYLTGGTPGLRDAVLVWLAMTGLPALKAARSAGKVEEHLEAWAKGRRPAELLAMQAQITSAVEAAFAPAAAGEDDSPADPAGDDPLDQLPKKGAQAAAGG